jgi:hypothetical protein
MERLWSQVRRVLLLFILVAAYFVGLPGPEGMARFRIPAMPTICLLAAMGMERVGKSKSVGVQTFSSS